MNRDNILLFRSSFIWQLRIESQMELFVYLAISAYWYLPDPMCLMLVVLWRLVVGVVTFPFITVYFNFSSSIIVFWELSGQYSYSISVKRARFALAEKLSSNFGPWDNEPSDIDVSNKDPRIAAPQSAADSQTTDTGIFGPIKCCWSILLPPLLLWL